MVPRVPRVIIEGPVEFTHEDGGTGIFFNLSPVGCAIRSDTPVTDGMLVSVRLRLSTNGDPIGIEMGRVRWARAKEFGVEFVMVSLTNRQAIERWIHRQIASPREESAA